MTGRKARPGYRDREAALARVATAQLAVGLGGLAVARKRKHAYDLPMLHGSVANLDRDAVWMGTAFSAPGPMLVAQAWATMRLRRGSARHGAARERLVLGTLGLMMVPGYLGEAQVRRRLRPAQWDPVESPLVACGVALAAAMAIIGLTGERASV